ncbi:TolC family protein [Parabacteroides sp. OttesenSCG-928-N08]|nr:TolC family protein [Parabacteroides sp. OttesenSCG-928-N08]
MNSLRYIILSFILVLGVEAVRGQERLALSLEETVEMARRHSPDAIAARHIFRAAYWNWRTYRANLLPSLTFNSNPQLNRSISPVTLPDGSDSYLHRELISVDAALTINQNLPFTGGSLFVSSSLERLDMLSDKSTSYKSVPFIIGYRQDLFGYNALKWDRRIEPVRYEEAKKNLVETLELVAARATYYFFQLATAQTNWEIACYNYANADTLYRFAEGRYQIGTITENEMLQLEINLLTEQTNRMNARIEVDDYMQLLRSYLGITERMELEVLPESEVPRFLVSEEEAMTLAYTNNPEPEAWKRQLIESESSVAAAKASRGFKADLYVQFGLTQSNEQWQESYKTPLDQQLVSLGIRIPLLDWGVGKGKVKVAASNRDRVQIQVDQARIDFELNVVKLVKQFNLQQDRVEIAGKTDKTAQRRNEVAQKLYLLGKSTILDLNASISEKDRARRDYITALYNYWNLYYGIRSLTGYDFRKQLPLTEDYELLMK